MYVDHRGYRSIIRYVCAIVVSVAFAYGINWPLAYVTPVFVAKFFADQKVPSRQTLYELVSAMLVTTGIALLVSMGLGEYPLLLLVFVGLVMFWAYYLFQDPDQDFFAMMLIMAILLVPYMAISQPSLALYFGQGLMASGVLAVVVFFSVHYLVPYQPLVDGTEPTPVELADDNVRVSHALRALMISFPVIAITYCLQMRGALLTMAFISMLSLDLSGPKSIKLGSFLLLANVSGGLIAVMLYELLAWVPHFPFMLALMALVSAVFGVRVFSAGATSPLYASAFSAVLVLLGAALTLSGRAIDSSFYSRIGQISAACFYLIIVACFLEFRQAATRTGKVTLRKN